MLTVNEAFKKLKTHLKLNQNEQSNASKRQQEVRACLEKELGIERSFLTGSYSRYTKTKPLEDVDIFFVSKDDDDGFHSKSPSEVIDAFHSVLADKYGESAVCKQRRSVGVDFGVVVDEDDNTDYRVVSVDAVPAVSVDSYYEIPDTKLGTWVQTNPEIHAQKATEAHTAYSEQWKGLVRILKYWNRNPRYEPKPIRPSFLIEVMALECLHGGWQGRFDYEVQGFFASLADRIFDDWPDPAGLGPLVSDGMSEQEKQRAQDLLRAAEKEAAHAIHLVRLGRNGDALKAWRALFGPKFPLT